MPLSKTEEKILRAVSENQLMTRNELKTLLKKDAGDKDVTVVLDTVVRGLVDKKLVSVITPIGSTCYVITQRGSQLLNGRE